MEDRVTRLEELYSSQTHPVELMSREMFQPVHSYEAGRCSLLPRKIKAAPNSMIPE